MTSGGVATQFQRILYTKAGILLHVTLGMGQASGQDQVVEEQGSDGRAWSGKPSVGVLSWGIKRMRVDREAREQRRVELVKETSIVRGSLRRVLLCPLNVMS